MKTTISNISKSKFKLINAVGNPNTKQIVCSYVQTMTNY